MSYEKAINEIQGLLTQTGIPPGHAQDIAARLSSALSLYYDYRANGGGGDNSSTNLDNISRANSEGAAFRNRFGAPEEDRKPGLAGRAGKDGLSAWARGATGAAGQDGQDGSSDNYNTFYDYSTTVVGGGSGVDLGRVPCDSLKKKLNDCGIKTGGGCEGCDKCNPKCCPGYGGTGMLNGQSLCAVVDSQARMLKEIRGRLDKIEKMLEDTVDCPDS